MLIKPILEKKQYWMPNYNCTRKAMLKAIIIFVNAKPKKTTAVNSCIDGKHDAHYH